MFQFITPHNNEWNRKFWFTGENGKGFFMHSKNGLAYFAWIFPENVVQFYTCEQGVFEKSFTIQAESLEYEIDPQGNIQFHRYPAG
ncbi:MAG TPA: hypothetical protein PLU53_07720 [Bacteroidia bacterium]|nr:hypothetical protein [Bacteroidia bacterium]